MLNYNAPVEGRPSSIDGSADQMQNFKWLRKAIIEARHELVFSPLTSMENMPKHFGKRIRVHHYIPILDDRNVNDQGIDANGVRIVDGNLYGSSRDVGTITAKLPVLTENGGRVNRVGFTRIQREGSLHKMGFFYELTQESLDFDSDDQLRDHLARELMTAAIKINEDVLQRDLLAAAGVVMWAGVADADNEITGEPGNVGGVPAPASIVSYRNLTRLNAVLDDNRAPKQTKMVTGSTYTDTRTVQAGRFAFVGSELAPLLEEITNKFGKEAFIPVHQYAAGTKISPNEIGSVGPIRFIQVQNMLHWAGAGAVATNNPGYRSTMVGGQERYDVFPIMILSSEAFVSLGFQTDGKNGKFTVITKMPGVGTADRNEPYGETGFSSIKWYYGMLVLRPEWIAVLKTVAPE